MVRYRQEKEGKEYSILPQGPANRLILQGHELNLYLLRLFFVFVIFFMFLVPGFDRVTDVKENRDEEEIQECNIKTKKNHLKGS